MQKLKRKIRPKNAYQGMLIEYLNRREKLRAKFGYKRGDHRHKKYAPEYLKAVELLNARIAHLRLQIKRIEKREVLLNQTNELVYEFLGVKVWRNRLKLRGGTSRHHPETVAARGIFVRYCMEVHRLESPMISAYLGSTTRGYASVFRKWFIREMQTNKYYNEIWQRFKNYLNREKIAA
jgi:hypothetical protein